MAIDPTGAINGTAPATAAVQTFPPEQISEFDRHLQHAAAQTDLSQLPRYASNDEASVGKALGVCSVEDANRRNLIEQYGGVDKLREQRRDLQEAYNSYRNEPGQGKYALYLRGQIDKIDGLLNPNGTFFRSNLSKSEQEYLAAEKENSLRTANNLAMAVGGPVFTGAGAIGRTMGASERQVSALIEANVNVVGTATLAKTLRPARTTPQTVASEKITEMPIKSVTRPQPNTAQTAPQAPSSTANTVSPPKPTSTTLATSSPQAGTPASHGSLPNHPSSAALTVADFPPVAAQVSQKQLRHILGRPEYRGGGYLNSVNDANAVLDAYHSGNAVILGKSAQGFPVVRVDSITGTNVNLSAGFPNQPTNVFMIKGTQSPSVVPMNPNWKP